MKDDLRYTPSECFETFPFPDASETTAELELAGRAYNEFRAALMVQRSEGLTKTYNRFHDPDEGDPGIRKLRNLHDSMDRAVLDAYGWTDLRPTCDFFLDLQDESVGDDDGKASKKRRPWRYRWPDAQWEEILARLLAINQRRSRGALIHVGA